MAKEELIELPLKDYFEQVLFALDKQVDLDGLTALFTDQPYKEKKPYLTRRQLTPLDRRFSKIEIVYSSGNPVSALVWHVKKSLSLSQLIDWFGEPVIQNEPYSNTTAFAFKNQSSDIGVILTRYPNLLTKSDNNILKFEFENEEHTHATITNPTFNFIQFNF